MSGIWPPLQRWYAKTLSVKFSKTAWQVSFWISPTIRRSSFFKSRMFRGLLTYTDDLRVPQRKKKSHRVKSHDLGGHWWSPLRSWRNWIVYREAWQVTPSRWNHNYWMFITSKQGQKIIYRLAGSPCFATVNLYLLRKVKALNFSLFLHYYVNSGQLLNYVYIDICLRRCLHRMPALKKRQKLPVVWKVFLQIHVKWWNEWTKISVCYKICF